MAIGAPSIGVGLTHSRLDAAVRELFYAGQQGFYFDPLDPTTAYQDSAGTTAGVVGQVLGLRLDKRLGPPTMGPNLVVNGTFAVDASGWSTTGIATANASSGQGVFASLGTVNQNVTQAITGLTIGRTYVWKRDVVSSVGSFRFSLGTAAGGAQIADGFTVGTGLATTFVATTTTVFVSAYSVSGAASVTVDNVMLWALPLGNHATQSTSASRPVWAQDGFGFYRDTFDGFDDSLNIAAGGGSATGFFYCAAINVAGGAGTARTIISDAGTNTGLRGRINATNQLELAAGNGVAYISIASAETLPVGGPYVVTLWDDGSALLNVQIGQGAVASIARPAVSAGTAGITEAKDNGAASSFFNGSLYTRVYRAGPPPSAAQIAQVQRFIASRAGVAL